MEFIKRHAAHIPLAGIVVVLIVLFVTIGVVAQHTIRADANWPQVQIAKDGAAQLNNNMAPQALIGSSVDMELSLAPFTNVYDLTGRVVTGAGRLNGQVAIPPRGALKASDDKAYHAVTWQPKGGVRIAAVIVKAKNYYVLSGRSLTEVEKNKSDVLAISLIAGLISSIVLTGSFWAGRHFRPILKHATHEHTVD